MRIVVQPRYRSGGAWIAGNWPPERVARLARPRCLAGDGHIRFIDAVKHRLDDDAIAGRLAEHSSDPAAVEAITPSIYASEGILELAREYAPRAQFVKAVGLVDELLAESLEASA